MEPANYFDVLDAHIGTSEIIYSERWSRDVLKSEWTDISAKRVMRILETSSAIARDVDNNGEMEDVRIFRLQQELTQQDVGKRIWRVGESELCIEEELIDTIRYPALAALCCFRFVIVLQNMRDGDTRLDCLFENPPPFSVSFTDELEAMENLDSFCWDNYTDIKREIQERFYEGDFITFKNDSANAQRYIDAQISRIEQEREARNLSAQEEHHSEQLKKQRRTINDNDIVCAKKNFKDGQDFSPRQVAALFCRSDQWVRDRELLGELEFIRLGRSVIITHASVKALWEKLHRN